MEQQKQELASSTPGYIVLMQSFEVRSTGRREEAAYTNR
jgi:hypothetical protein